MSYQSDYSGAQVVEAVGKALNPDATPTEGSTNLVQSGGVASAVSTVGNAVSRRNLLDNWYFVGGGSQQGGGQFPINQRGQTSYIGVGYGIDRWYTNAGGTFAQIVNSGYMTFKVYTQYAGMVQFVEEPRIIDGQTYTLSVLTASGCYSWTFAASKSTGRASPIGWYGVEKMYSYVDFYSNGAWRIFVFDSASDNTEKTVDVIAAKLELGDTQTLAHQENGVWVLNDIPNYAEELAKCQYYFYRVKDGEPLYGSRSIGAANYSSFRVPVIMRATPTATKNGGTITIYGQNGTQYGFSSFNNVNINYNAIGVYLSQNGSYAGEKLVMFNSGGTIDLSADL